MSERNDNHGGCHHGIVMEVFCRCWGGTNDRRSGMPVVMKELVWGTWNASRREVSTLSPREY